MAIEVFHASAALHLASFRNVAINHAGGLLHFSDMQRIAESYRALIKRQPEGIATYVVVCPGTPVADREALAESARFMAELRPQILSAAVVIEERDLMAQMLTTVIRGINVITRHKALQVFASHDDALRATAPFVVKGAPGEEITALLKQAVSDARDLWRRNAR